MPEHQQKQNDNDLMNAIIMELREYVGKWRVRQNFEVRELIKQYEAGNIESLDKLISSLCKIRHTTTGNLFKAKINISKLLALITLKPDSVPTVSFLSASANQLLEYSEQALLRPISTPYLADFCIEELEKYTRQLTALNKSEVRKLIIDYHVGGYKSPVDIVRRLRGIESNVHGHLEKTKKNIVIIIALALIGLGPNSTANLRLVRPLSAFREKNKTENKNIEEPKKLTEIPKPRVLNPELTSAEKLFIQRKIGSFFGISNVQASGTKNAVIIQAKFYWKWREPIIHSIRSTGAQIYGQRIEGKFSDCVDDWVGIIKNLGYQDVLNLSHVVDSLAGFSLEAWSSEYRDLLNPDKNDLILQLGRALLKGNYQKEIDFINISQMYLAQVRDSHLQLRLECESAIEGKEGLSSSAVVLLGLLHRFGFGVEKNIVEAKKYFDIASNHGHTQALYYLAMMYRDGDLIQSFKYAMTLLGRGVLKENSSAMVALAEMYESGKCTESQNIIEAERLYRQAAALGNSLAMSKLARFSCFGQSFRSVIHHLPECCRLIHKGINLGDSEAMYALACLHTFQNDFGKNYSKALKLSRLALMLGNLNALFHLALMYEKGYGVEKNLTRAKLLRQKVPEAIQQEIELINPAALPKALTDKDRDSIKKYFLNAYHGRCSTINGTKDSVVINITIPQECFGQLAGDLFPKGAKLSTCESSDGQLTVTIKKMKYQDFFSLPLATESPTSVNDSDEAAKAASSGAVRPEFEELDEQTLAAGPSVASSSQSMFGHQDIPEKETIEVEVPLTPR